MKRLLAKIEENRQMMIHSAFLYGLSSQETIECSQNLDRLLNQLNQSKKIVSTKNVKSHG